MAQVLSTGYQRAMKSSQVVIGGTALAFASWRANVTGDDLPTRNFESYDAATAQSYDEGIIGFLGCGGDYGGDWDAHLNPIDLTAAAPPGLYPRDDLADIQFVVSQVDLNEWNFPYQRIISCSNGGDVEGKVTFTASYKSQGVFDFPTGSV